MRYDCYEMARPKCYETAALKQKAYRERKRKASSDWDKATVLGHHQKPTIEALRDLIKQEEEKPRVEVSAAPVGGIYRNDQGGVISKFAWEKLQRMKEDAKKGGYVLDEYTQT